MDKYREEIKQDLVRLEDMKPLLFAALICERLYPNYLYFHSVFNWGDPGVLREAIKIIFQSVIKKDLFEKEEILAMIEAVELITPDTNEFQEIYASFALDACTAVSSTLNYIIDQELEHIVDVAIYARDTVDMFIQERDDIHLFTINSEIRISSDPLMIHEKTRQKDSIERMLNKNFGDEINDQFIESLRDKSPLINIDVLE